MSEQKSWTGDISVTITATFNYGVDELWEARDEAHAREMVECELTDYIGSAWVDRRFEETWKVQADE